MVVGSANGMYKYACLLMLTALLILNISIANSSPNTLPTWAKNPPQNTPDFIYGVGEGSTVEQAQKASLATISGFFQSAVSQKYSDYEQMQDGRYQRDTRIFTQVNTETSLSNVEYIKTHDAKNGIFVLAQLDVNEFSRNNEARWAAIDTEITSWFTRISSMTYLDIVLNNEHIENRIDEAQRLQLVWNALSPQPTFIENVKRYVAYKNLKNEQLQKGFVYLKFSDKDYSSKKVEKLLKQKLSSLGINTRPFNSNDKSNNIPTIEVFTSNTESQDDRQAYLSRLSVALTSRINRSELGNNTFNSQGRSYRDHDQALDKAIQRIKLNLRKKDLAELLGLEAQQY